MKNRAFFGNISYAKLLDFLCLEVSFGRPWPGVWLELVIYISLVTCKSLRCCKNASFSAVFQLLCGRWFLCQAFSPTTMNTGKGDLSHGEVFYCGQCELSIHRFPFNEINVFRRSFGTIGCHDYSSIASSHHLLFDHTLNIGLTCPAPSQQFDKNGSQPALGRILWRPKEEVGRNLMTFR